MQLASLFVEGDAAHAIIGHHGCPALRMLDKQVTHAWSAAVGAAGSTCKSLLYAPELIGDLQQSGSARPPQADRLQRRQLPV